MIFRLLILYVLGKFMHMKTRQVLTVNQVFEIISNFSECNDWEKSFVSVLPKRKGAEVICPKTSLLEMDNSVNESAKTDTCVDDKEAHKNSGSNQ